MGHRLALGPFVAVNRAAPQQKRDNVVTTVPINIFYQNVRGLKTKLSHWNASLLVSDHMLVAATETFLDGSVEDAEVVPDSWTLLRRDRATPCGGVLLAARHDVTMRRRKELESELGEDLWASISFRGISFIVCVIYVKPKAADDVYMNIFCKIESFMSNNPNCKFLIFGDLNLNSASINIKNYYCYFVTYCNLIEFNDIRNSHGSILDVVLVRECNESWMQQVRVSEAGAGFVPPDRLYHPPLEIVVSLLLNNTKDNCDQLLPSNVDPRRDWNFTKIDLNLFQSLLDKILWQSVLECNDPSTAAEALYSILYDLFDKAIPKKRRFSSNGSRYPVWFDAKIIRDTKRKTQLHKAWLSSFCDSTYKEFSLMRASLKARISIAYKAHVARIEESLRLKPRYFWSHVHSLRSKGGFEPCVSYRGKSCTGVEAAEAFASYFSSVFLDNLPLLDASTCREQGLQGGHVSLPAVSMQDIERSINKLKLSSSLGPDNVPSSILKACGEQLAIPLYHIFNLSLRFGRYPDQWKLSRVTPIPKSSNKSLVEEYRPIAILCAPAKVFEYILHNHIYRQVKQILGDEQHGFRPGRSVNTNLLCLVDYISNAMDRGLQVDVIYFDFQKAFDKIDNDILLSKLSAIGFTPSLLKFFSDYMRDRRQYVRHGIYQSEQYHTRSGVSQGSVLGPLLFIIMIHDLAKVLTTARCLLYADDLKIFLEIKSLNDCLSIQNDIDLIYKWSESNKMTFNLNKCTSMTFDRKNSPIIFDYHLNRVAIRRESCIKDLGIMFDRALTFHDHINNLAQESFRRLGFVLRNARDFRNPRVITTLYNALVKSKLESGACVWNPYHVTYARILEKVQKAFLRFLYKKVNGYYPYRYPTKFLMGHLGFNSLEVRRTVDQIITCLKLMRGSIDCPTLHNLVCVLSVPNELEPPISRRGPVKQHRLFYVDAGRTIARARSPLVRPLRHLNALRDTNTDFDIAFDKWSTLVPAILKYCENLRDQWTGTGGSDSSDSDGD